MATTTVYSNTSDGYLTCTNGTYSVAKEGTGTLSSNTASASLFVGQNFSASTYECTESFLNFDVSGIDPSDTVTAASLELWLTTDQSTTDFVVNAKTYDWGASLTSADFVAGSAMSALTLLATLDSNGIGSTGAYKSFTLSGTALVDAIIAAIAGDGIVRIGLFSSRQEAGNTPSGIERMTFSSANVAGTTQDPKLTITHVAGGVASATITVWGM